MNIHHTQRMARPIRIYRRHTAAVKLAWDSLAVVCGALALWLMLAGSNFFIALFGGIVLLVVGIFAHAFSAAVKE